MQYVKKYWPWLAGILVAYVLYKIISNRIGSKEDSLPVIQTPTGPAIPSFSYDVSKVERDKTFGVGAKNSQEVGYLQTWLNTYFASGLKVDGDWGAKTTAALLMVKPLTNTVSTTLNKLEI